MAVAGAAVLVGFVLPHWREYQFYNWQMSVERKPDYSLAAFVTNASWLPIASDFFTRQWLALSASALSVAVIARTWGTAKPAARLLVLWVAMGLVELVVHGSGEERYYVVLIPALVALTALWLDGPLTEPGHEVGANPWSQGIAAPLVLLLAYLVIGSLVRLQYLPQIGVADYKAAVRLSASLALIVGGTVIWLWPSLTRWLAGIRVAPVVAAALVLIALGWNVTEFAQWARQRQYLNYWASREIGGLLPPGTLVHGKLANGLSLENRIRPVFIGTHFGNYDDRFERNDVRYILTYQSPWIGYESSTGGRLIQDLLDRYPAHRLVATFNVNETGGADRAALFDKFSAARSITASLVPGVSPPGRTPAVAPAPPGGPRARH
jgi:hypothetical protein